MEKREKLEVHALRDALAGLGELRISDTTTEADAQDAIRALAEWNGCTVGVVRFSGETPWEKHAEDELLHVLEGEVEITVLRPGARSVGTAGAGSVVVVPRDCWHRQRASATTTLLFVTGTTDVSTADDPR